MSPLTDPPVFVSLLSDGSSEDGMSSLGSPSDPCLSPLAWSVTGRYLASAMEKMVNIWQVNGKPSVSFLLLTSDQSL